MVAALSVAALLVVTAVVASRVTLNYYVLSPGDAESVGPLITVPADRAHHLHGAVLLTDVFEGPVTALSYLPDRLSSNDQLVPTGDLVPSGIPVSELDAQGYLEMTQAKDDAKTAALRRLGYAVPEQDAGVVIEGVTSGTPAFSVLKVADVVSAVDGHPTTTLCSFAAQLGALRPGEDARLLVQHNRFSASGTLVHGATVTESVRLLKRPRGTPGAGRCKGYKASGGFLGVVVSTQQDFTFPFPITIDTANIGGPSAGLAMTLGLINTLSGGGLTGGRIVAATGTIDPKGNVGDVGGVAQKTIAVEAARASVFFVPVPELAAARSKATPGLHVYAVATLAQALGDLERLGGRVPPVPARPSTPAIGAGQGTEASRHLPLGGVARHRLDPCPQASPRRGCTRTR
jgi:Lon-like protease